MNKKNLQRYISWVLMIMGVVAILASILINPQIASKYLSPDGHITKSGLQQLKIYRICSFISGIVLITVSVVWRKYRLRILQFFDRKISVSFRHGLLILLIAIAFHISIYALKTLYNSFLVENKLYFAPLREDIMISMRYADNLSKGYGLVWNIGEKVEGYTNFLWTIILSIPHFLGLPKNYAFLFPVILNLLFFFISALLAFKLLRLIKVSPIVSLMATSVFCFFLPFAYWGSMGFETSMIVLCSIIAIYYITKGLLLRRSGCFILASLGLGLGWLARDSYAIIFFSSAVLIAGLYIKFSLSFRKIAVVFVLPFLIKLFHEIFRYLYYGNLLPNTYYLKALNWNKISQLQRGFEYTLNFYLMIVPILALLLWGLTSYFSGINLKEKNMPIFAVVGVSMLSILFQTMYVIWVGGDAFNNFRFYVLLAPFISLLVGISLDNIKFIIEGKTYFSLPIYCLFILGLLFNMFGRFETDILKSPPFFKIEIRAKETKRQFLNFVGIREYGVTAPERNIRTAQAIQSQAQFDNSQSVGVFYAGTLPYLLGPEYYCIDYLGKMDPYIASQEAKGNLPGHNKWDFEYSLGEKKPEISLSMGRLSDNEPFLQQLHGFQKRGGFVGALYKSNTFLTSYHLAYRVNRGFDLYKRNHVDKQEPNLQNLLNQQ